jgi:hypothetical protein
MENKHLRTAMGMDNSSTGILVKWVWAVSHGRIRKWKPLGIRECERLVLFATYCTENATVSARRIVHLFFSLVW